LKALDVTRNIFHSIGEGLHHPVIRVLGLILTTIVTTTGAILGLLKTGVIPRVIYMPGKDILLLEQVQGGAPKHSQNTPAGSVTIKETPKPTRTPDDRIVTVSERGMAAVRFMLRFQSVNDAGKAKLAEENDGNTVDWELVVDGNLGMVLGRPLLDCSPPHFGHWSRETISILVTVGEKSEDAALSLQQHVLIHAHGKLKVSETSVSIEDAQVEPVEQSE
jgi:hypothetical protein